MLYGVTRLVEIDFVAQGYYLPLWYWTTFPASPVSVVHGVRAVFARSAPYLIRSETKPEPPGLEPGMNVHVALRAFGRFLP